MGGGIFRGRATVRGPHLVLQRFEPPRRRQKLHPAEGVRFVEGSKRIQKTIKKKKSNLSFFLMFFFRKMSFLFGVFFFVKVKEKHIGNFSTSF